MGNQSNTVVVQLRRMYIITINFAESSYIYILLYTNSVPDVPRVEAVIPRYSNNTQSLVGLTLIINQTVSFNLVC